MPWFIINFIITVLHVLCTRALVILTTHAEATLVSQFSEFCMIFSIVQNASYIYNVCADSLLHQIRASDQNMASASSDLSDPCMSHVSQNYQ